jgi:hypothetical protein
MSDHQDSHRTGMRATMPRSSEADHAARLLVTNIARLTRGQPMKWVSLHEVTGHLDQAAAVHAVSVAEAKGWLTIEGGHSVCLTEKGRTLIED